MSSPPVPRTEINGQAARAEQLQFPALVNYGHFTAMQVRNRAVRGLDLHLTRLERATGELYGAGLDAGLVRARIRHALGGQSADATVRVTIFRPDDDAEMSIMVAVSAAAGPPSAPQSLRSVCYQRPLAHIKHTGTFGQIYYRRLAAREGFDEALLVDHDAVISEGAITNIGCCDGDTIVWPDAPALHGITMQLLERAAHGQGLGSQRQTVRLGDLSSSGTVFLANSRGICAVDRVDDVTLPVDPEAMKTVTELYQRNPWDPI